MFTGQDLRHTNSQTIQAQSASDFRNFGESKKMKTDGLKRETFTLPTEEARQKAKEWLKKYPTAAYWSRVESWEELTDGRIRFTMVRLPTAD